ncbi:BQ2448_3504 [Microbotryum intermedium]|uniref:Ras modification protein ERF4 n=1 Tax=Microbotryum intermedium TaxID=269621 RepID=A0A238FA69_9BASI|nr:BQ2448_3504 [Microbotryum intermedium]
MASEGSTFSPSSNSPRKENAITRSAFNATVSLDTMGGDRPTTSGTSPTPASEFLPPPMNDRATFPSTLSELPRRTVSEPNDPTNGPTGLGAWRSVQSGLVSSNGAGAGGQIFHDPIRPRGIIGKTKPRMVLRVERDHSDGQTCQFCCDWISELEGRVTRKEFESTLNDMNAILASAHDPYRSILDNCCAILTFYLSPKLFPSHFAQSMREFDRILESANQIIYNPVGLNILPPRRTAFLFLEIELY